MPSTSAERMRKMRKLNAEDPERKTRKLDTIYMFGCVEIAIIIDVFGEIWFRGVDLARALEIDNPNTAITDVLYDKYYKSFENLLLNERYQHIPGMHPKTIFVNEMGAYRFLLRSRMPLATAFFDWICAEILPKTKALQANHVFEDLDERRKQYLEGFIYLATSDKYKKDNIYKIGYAKNVSKRVSALNVSRCSDLLTVYVCCPVKNARLTERALHLHFKSKLVRGEFYCLDSKDIQYVSDYCNLYNE
nr:hypothetical protein [Microctonus hyperodae filamentous virus]